MVQGLRTATHGHSPEPYSLEDREVWEQMTARGEFSKPTHLQAAKLLYGIKEEERSRPEEFTDEEKLVIT